MTAPRFWGALVALASILLIVLSVFAYDRAVEELVLPTGGVTDRGVADDVPTSKSADAALAARARLQDWRGASGPAPDEPAAAAAGQRLEAEPSAKSAPRMQPWATATPQDGSLYRDRSFVAGITSLPDPKAGVLIQEAGRDWRRFHNVELTVGGGIVLFAVLALLGGFLAWRGRLRLDEGFSGETVERFGRLERFNHWMTATSFILVALTGLILLYGQFFLRPLTGAGLYSEVASASVLLHIGFAVPFILGVATMAVLWIRQNGLTKVDLGWLKKGGGMIVDTKEAAHAYKFNAGQKLIFWAVVLSAFVLTASGVTLLFPFFWFDIAGMQLALIAHAVVAMIMVAVILGHIYIGTIGMEGAFDAMWSGKVDRNWAEEHHDLWMAEKRGGTAAE